MGIQLNETDILAPEEEPDRMEILLNRNFPAVISTTSRKWHPFDDKDSGQSALVVSGRDRRIHIHPAPQPAAATDYTVVASSTRQA